MTNSWIYGRGTAFRTKPKYPSRIIGYSMTIPVLFDFVRSVILLLSVTAFSLAFIYLYASEAKKNNK